MPPTAEDRLRDILEAITGIEELIAGGNLAQFRADKVCRMATERYLEIVCETAQKLTADIKLDAPDIEWRKMIDFGHMLRHATQPTNVETVWDIVQNDLAPLKSFVIRKIATS